MNWLHHIITKPHIKTGVACFIIGPQGTGKSTVGEVIARLFNTAAQQSTGLDPLVADFNSSLAECVFYVCDEMKQASKSENSEQAGKLKSVVTERFFLLHEKYKNRVRAEQFLNLYGSFNNLVPILIDSVVGNRRYWLVETCKEFPNKALLSTIKNWINFPETEESQNVFTHFLSLLFHMDKLEGGVFDTYKHKWNTRSALERFPVTKTLSEAMLVKAQMPVRFLKALHDCEIIGLLLDDDGASMRDKRYKLTQNPEIFTKLFVQVTKDQTTWPVNKQQLEFIKDEDGKYVLKPNLWLTPEECMIAFGQFAIAQGYNDAKINNMSLPKLRSFLDRQMTYSRHKGQYDVKTLTMTGYTDEFQLFMIHWLTKGLVSVLEETDQEEIVLPHDRKFSFSSLYEVFYEAYKKEKNLSEDRFLSNREFALKANNWFTIKQERINGKNEKFYYLEKNIEKEFPIPDLDDLLESDQEVELEFEMENLELDA
eukprot:Pgem_evm1s19532